MKWWMWVLLGLGALFIIRAMSSTVTPGTIVPEMGGNLRRNIGDTGLGGSVTIRFGNGYTGS